MRTFRVIKYATFRPNSGAMPFLASMLIWGVGIGCIAAALNNFLVDSYDVNQFQRGILEFFRELPGLMLVFILACVHRFSDWKLLRLGMLITMVGAMALCIPANFYIVTLLIMLWSVGEHIVLPMRSTIPMQVARKGREGASLGIVSSAHNAGLVVGNLLVALIFLLGLRYFGMDSRLALYKVVWLLVGALILISVICTLSPQAPQVTTRRPRLLIKRKFTLYYLLELFYGARKQIFMTFGPFVLIRMYAVDTSQMALLLGVSAIINMAVVPWLGLLIDRIGYRTIMVYDTFILVFVCLLYGFANEWFPHHIAYWVVCANFLLDALISNTTLATSIYVRAIADNNDEVTATLSTGISMNHLISIIVAPLGGWVWMSWGVGTLFGISALMSIANSWCAMQIPIQSRKRERS